MNDSATSRTSTLIELRSKSTECAFRAEPQEPLLYAALRAGAAVPYECGTGTCGTCKARRTAGVITEDWADAPGRAFINSERGEVLLCRTRALSNSSFEIPGRIDLASAPRRRPRFGGGNIARLDRLTEDMIAVRVDVDPGLEFEAGQFAVLRVAHISGYRAYSMVNHPASAGEIEFAVKRKPGGAFTDWLFSAARSGDLVEWFGPLGKATFDPQEQRTLLCISGGSGIAPIMSILELASASRYFEHFEGSVLFGVRTNADVFYLDRLSRFAAGAPDRLSIIVALSHDTPSKELRRHYPALSFESGFPHEIAARQLANRFAGRLAFVAGPPILVDVTIRMLITQGRLPARDIRYDKFS